MRGVAQPNLAAVPPGGELEPSQRVDRHRIGLDTAHVAQDDRGPVPCEELADALAEPGQVGTGDGTADGYLELRGRRRAAERVTLAPSLTG